MSPPVIILSRAPRGPGLPWARTRSQLGGAPLLGARPWPRGPKGAPLHLLAQIDCAELSAAVGPTPFPARGLLLFFAGPTGAVVHVPEAEAAPAEPPAGLASAYLPGNPYSDLGEAVVPGAPKQFRRWPLSFLALPDPGWTPGEEDAEEGWREQVGSAIDRHLARRRSNLDAASAWGTERRQPHPVHWRTAQMMVEGLARASADHLPRLALRESVLAQARAQVATLRPPTLARLFGRPPAPGLEAALERQAVAARSVEAFRASRPAFLAMVAQAQAMIAGRDPWSLMEEADLAAFDALARRARAEFDTHASGHVRIDWRALEAETVAEMMTGEDAVVARLPAAVRERINAGYRLTAGGWHQMLGVPVFIQGDAVDQVEGGKVLLLQLHADDLMHWSFGDAGAFSWYLSPEDLAAGRFERATGVFECY